MTFVNIVLECACLRVYTKSSAEYVHASVCMHIYLCVNLL